MSKKKKLKEKNKKLKTALKRVDIEMRLLQSDFLIDKQKLSHRVVFAEGQVRSLMGDLTRLQNRMREEINAARDREKTTSIPEVPSNGASVEGTPEHAGNTSGDVQPG